MNKELLLKVKEHIVQFPHMLEMGSFHSHCGTAHCIAGWCDVIQRGQYLGDSFAVASRAADDLKLADEAMADRLFYVSNWPVEFSRPYWREKEEGEHSQVALITASRIDHFIATKGME